MSETPPYGPIVFGKIVIIKRSGKDGTIFPLTMSNCMFGRGDSCSIRIQLDDVEEQHCYVEVLKNKKVSVTNLGSHPTLLNGKTVRGSHILSHKDMLSISDRHFRFEYPDGENLQVTTELSKKKRISVSPKKKSTPSRVRSKSLDVGKTPPHKLLSSPFDENTSPSTRRMMRRAQPAINELDTPSKILTPIAKPPTPSEVAMTSSSVAPKSPAAPGRRTSADLRKSLTELRQRSDSIAESPEDSLPKSERKSAGQKRASKSPLTSASKRKRVSFGSELSPELFDKRLPAGTPLQRGSNPRNEVAEGDSRRSGLLKRRSVSVAPTSAAILEESPKLRTSPRLNTTDKQPTLPTISAKKMEKSSRHVTLMSPHIVHQEMSHEEVERYAEIRQEEGEMFRRLSHSPENALSPPITPADKKYVPNSASPKLTKSLGKSSAAFSSPKLASPAQRIASPVRASSRNPTPGSSRSPKPQNIRNNSQTRVLMTPGNSTVIHMDTPRPANLADSPRTPATSSPTLKSVKKTRQPEVVVKIRLSPPMEFKKAVALRAIHGKHATPSLPPAAKRALTPKKAVTPKETTSASKNTTSSRTPTPNKTTIHKKATPKKISTPKNHTTPRKTATPNKVKKTWADVVKTTGKRKSIGTKASKAKEVVSKVKKAAVKRTAAKKTVLKAEVISKKTPVRVKNSVCSTGHADSPATIVLSRYKKRVSPNKMPPEELEMEQDDLPPTPEGPGVMYVSPLSYESGRKRLSVLINESVEQASPVLTGIREMMRSSHTRKSVGLVGVKEVMHQSKNRPSVSLKGVKEMMRTEKAASSPNLKGVKEMMQTEKHTKSPNMKGVKELMRIKKSAGSPELRGMKEMFQLEKAGVSPSLVGLSDLFADVNIKASKTTRKAINVKAGSSKKKHDVSSVKRAVKAVSIDLQANATNILEESGLSPTKRRRVVSNKGDDERNNSHIATETIVAVSKSRRKKTTSSVLETTHGVSASECTAKQRRGETINNEKSGAIRGKKTAQKATFSANTKTGRKPATLALAATEAPNLKKVYKKLSPILEEQAVKLEKPHRGRQKNQAEAVADMPDKQIKTLNKRQTEKVMESKSDLEPTPKRRGRPAKVVEPKVVVKTSPKKRGRTEKVMEPKSDVEPTPKRRGRPAKVVEPKVDVKPAPRTRGRAEKVIEPKSVVELKSDMEPTTKRRGRAAKVVEPKVDVKPAPRTRGRAEKVIEPKSVVELKSDMEHTTKRRGRPAKVVEPKFDVKTSPKKRGQAEKVIEPKSVVESKSDVEPTPRRRGRPAKVVEPKVDVKTSRKKRGRTEKVIEAKSDVEPTPKKRSRTAKVVEPQPEPEVEPKKLAQSVKAVKSISVETVNKKRGGATKALNPKPEVEPIPRKRGGSAKVVESKQVVRGKARFDASEVINVVSQSERRTRSKRAS